MAIKFETVKAGDELWDVHSYRMGNTTMRAMGSWRVLVISIDHEKGEALCSWNGNRPERYPRYRVERLRRSPYKPKPRRKDGGLR